jgi:hypothetical protein
MGEGWNPAWTAHIGSTDLGAPLQIDGGSNGWWLSPGTQSRTITLTWPPQQSLNRSLLISAIAVLLCCVVTLRRRPRGVALPDAPPTLHSAARNHASFTRSAVVALGIVASAALFASPTMALWAIIPATAVLVARRPRLAVAAGVVLLGALALLVVVQQHRHGYRADAGWPLQFERWHPWGMLALTLIGAGAALDTE